VAERPKVQHLKCRVWPKEMSEGLPVALATSLSSSDALVMGMMGTYGRDALLRLSAGLAPVGQHRHKTHLHIVLRQNDIFLPLLLEKDDRSGR
jgi:hypothetical protein